MQRLPEWPHEEKILKFSPREKQVWTMIVRGYPNKEIALALGIKVKTVEAHKSRIAVKLGVPSVREVRNLAITALLHENEQLRNRLELLGVAADF